MFGIIEPDLTANFVTTAGKVALYYLLELLGLLVAGYPVNVLINLRFYRKDVLERPSEWYG